MPVGPSQEDWYKLQTDHLREKRTIVVGKVHTQQQNGFKPFVR